MDLHPLETLQHMLTILQALPPEKLAQRPIFFDFDNQTAGKITGLHSVDISFSIQQQPSDRTAEELQQLPLIFTLSPLSRAEAADVFQLPELADPQASPCTCAHCQAMRAADEALAQQSQALTDNFKALLAKIKEECNIEARSLPAPEWNFLFLHLIENYGKRATETIMQDIVCLPDTEA